MTLMRSIALLAILSVNASANDISGIWKARFIGPVERRPKMVSEMTFEIKVEGDKLTGMAHMSNWPGDASLTEGKIDGDRISFTAIGKLPWGSRGPMGNAAGYPKLDFTGVLHGDEVQLTLTWGSIMIEGDNPGVRIYEMQGKRLPDSK